MPIWVDIFYVLFALSLLGYVLRWGLVFLFYWAGNQIKQDGRGVPLIEKIFGL